MYHFIANSASYLNSAFFSDSFFLAPVISRIKSIGGGRVKGRRGRLKKPKGGLSNHLDSKSSAVLQYLP